MPETPEVQRPLIRNLRRPACYVGLLATLSTGSIFYTSGHNSEQSHPLIMTAGLAQGYMHAMDGVRMQTPSGLAVTERQDGKIAKSSNPVNKPVPKDVHKFMDRNTLYLTSIGCSGEAIRNDVGRLIGALTAEHCSLTYLDNERIQGSDGEHYIIQNSGVQAQTGDKLSDVKTVGIIDEFVVPKSTDKNRDLAIGIVKGHTPREVVNAYKEHALSVPELRKLRPGQTVYMSGWPVYQPNNKSHDIKRQSFSLMQMGKGVVSTTKGKNLPVIWTANAPTKQGAECSYGASGSMGFIWEEGKPRSIGTLSAFYDLSGNVDKTKKSEGKHYPFIGTTDGIAAVCGFTYEVPQLPKNGMVIHSVRSGSEIPGYVSIERASEIATAQFSDPTQTKTYLDGVAFLQDSFGQNDAVSDPLVYHDAKHHFTVFGWAEPDAENRFRLAYYEDRHLNMIGLVSHEGSQSVDFKETTGAEIFQADPTKLTSGGFIDPEKRLIGSQLFDTTGLIGVNFSLSEQDGVLIPVVQKLG